jgi:glucose-1-phosphate adenylyltransferase
MYTFIHTDYWEDIGTIKAFYETNLSLARPNPEFNFYDENRPIYTLRKDLPAIKMINCSLHNTIAAEGCILQNASIMNSVIGLRTIIADDVILDGVVCLGADSYETGTEKSENVRMSQPDIGIGRGTTIRRAIIDLNTRIGRYCKIGLGDTPREDGDYDGYSVRDGIIVIPKGEVLPDGTII